MRKRRLITDLKMLKVIFDETACNETDKNTTVVAYSKFFLRIVEIGEKYNQCLQFALQSRLLFYGILLTGQIQIQQCDLMKTHFFNRMLGYNKVFYDEDTKHWYWDEINS